MVKQSFLNFDGNKPFLKKIIFICIIFLIYLKEKKNFDSNFIKVAFYCNSIKYGGVERVISLLIKRRISNIKKYKKDNAM